jgi:hypothetical protein
MSRYAEGTSVPMDRSRAEAEKTLVRYGAHAFAYSWEQRVEVIPARCTANGCTKSDPDYCRREHRWMVTEQRRDTRQVVILGFRMTLDGTEREVRLEVPMPTEREAGTKAKLDAATRQRWRALVLVLKAKLEAVASGISTLETEFLAGIVMPDGRTLGSHVIPRLTEVVEHGRLLPPAEPR